MKKRITLLGSTGSIGTQTLRCCSRLGIEVAALAAGSNAKLLAQQAREFCVRRVAIADKSAYNDLRELLDGLPVEVLAGEDAVCELAAGENAGMVCNAVVGIAGLRPTLAALNAGHDVALANKETLVAAGALVTATAKKNGCRLLPVDSEHSAVFQCLQGSGGEYSRILLTASGGPFRQKTLDELRHVTLNEALKHPNWSMGAKITVDSASMMNKGLEVIEAMWLFGARLGQIEVLVHPQSIVHSAVELADGAVIAQLGSPDMAVPIQYALTYPERMATNVKPLSLADIGALTFEKPDYERFPCLKLAMDAAERGGLYPCAANSANEQAVAMFISGRISFGSIAKCVAHVLEKIAPKSGSEYALDDVLETDAASRAIALEYCGVPAE